MRPYSVLMASSLLMLSAAVVMTLDGPIDGRATALAIGSAMHAIAAALGHDLSDASKMNIFRAWHSLSDSTQAEAFRVLGVTGEIPCNTNERLHVLLGESRANGNLSQAYEYIESVAAEQARFALYELPPRHRLAVLNLSDWDRQQLITELERGQ